MDKVTFGDNLPGYEFGAKSAPALVVVQEWFGVNEAIKELAILLSEKMGVRVLIPDLYKGKIGVDAEEAAHLMHALDFKQAVMELKEAVTYLKSTGSAKVGIIGFCMGGALSFAAAQRSGVDCAAPFYGIPPEAICDFTQIKVPVQGHFGELDTHTGFADPASAKAILEKMKAAGCNVEIFIHPGCGHGYMNILTPHGKEKIEQMKFPEAPSAELEATLASLSVFFKQHLF